MVPAPSGMTYSVGMSGTVVALQITVFNAVDSQRKAAECSDFIEAGKSITAMWLPSKALILIVLTLFGSVSVVRALIENALSPMTSRDAGNVSEAIPHPQNASSPMMVTPSGKDTDVRLPCK